MTVRQTAPAPLPPTASVADFFRTPNTNGALPDGTADTTEAIARAGHVGLGLANATAPVAQLDVAAAARALIAGGNHDGDTAGTGLYVTASSGGWTQSGDYVPVAPTAAMLARFRHSNGTQGLAIGFSGIQHETTTTTNTTFMLGTTSPNTVHARGWAGWLDNVAYRDNLNSSFVPAVQGAGWHLRFWDNTQQFAAQHFTRPSENVRAFANKAAMYDLWLTQNGTGQPQHQAVRLAHRVLPATIQRGHAGNALATTAVNQFSHLFTGVAGANAAALVHYVAPNSATIVDGPDTTQAWAGIGSVAGPQGGTHAVVYTQGRVGGGHAFVGPPSRLPNVSGTPTAAPQETILTLWEQADESRARFGLGLPQGATEPAGLAIGELWVTPDGVVHCKLT